MTTTALLIALALATAPPPDDPAAALAARAVSGEPTAREDAAGRLEEIGPASLPALRIARGKAEGDEAAWVLDGLIDLIERNRLLRGTPVGLGADDVTVAEALADLGRRTGVRMALDPADDPLWRSRRVTLAPTGPVPFWEAVDRLGEAGGFRPGLGAWWPVPDPAKPDPLLRLSRRDEGEVRASVVGAFRVDLIGLERDRWAEQVRPGAPPKGGDTFAATLRLLGEPGLEIDRNGPPRVVEAVDASGADLRPSSANLADPAAAAGPAIWFRTWRSEPILAPTIRVPLAIPAAPGGTLARFRGEIPIIAMARTGPLMTIRLDGAEGRPFAASGVTLVFNQVDRLVTPRANPLGGRIGSFRVTVRGEPMNPPPHIAPGPRALTVGPLRPTYHADDHFQVLDDRGRAYSLSSNLLTPQPDGSFEARVQIHPAVGLGPPATVRYFGVVAEAIEVPFGFEGVPLP